MNQLKNLIAGMAGAAALNILHETLRKKYDNVPRVDLVGKEAVQKTLTHFGKPITNDNHLYQVTLAGDLLSNAAYYALIGSGKSQAVWSKSIVIGLAAGIGAVALPEPMGLDPQPVTKSNQVKLLTVGYYLFGALVTGAVLKILQKGK